MKLFLDEPHAEALREYVVRHSGGASCALAQVEVVRVAREYGADSVAQAQAALGRLRLLELDDALLDSAGLLAVPVRTLDAIHLAAAQALGDELSAVVTYDARMRRAAEELGMTVVSPGAD